MYADKHGEIICWEIFLARWIKVKSLQVLSLKTKNFGEYP